VRMRAEVESIDVASGRVDRPQSKSCPGLPPSYAHTRPINDQSPASCTIDYARSSAIMPGLTYPVAVQAHWVVRYQEENGAWLRAGGGATPAQVRDTAVEEIQTVVQ
jgi:hypothetical protein